MGGADVDWHATQILWLTGRCPSTHRPQILNNGNSTYADLSALTEELSGAAAPGGVRCSGCWAAKAWGARPCLWQDAGAGRVIEEPTEASRGDPLAAPNYAHRSPATNGEHRGSRRPWRGDGSLYTQPDLIGVSNELPSPNRTFLIRTPIAAQR